jgi:endoglucanase
MLLPILRLMNSLTRVAVLVLVFAAAIAVHAQTNPPKLATQARFDLSGSTSVGSLTNGYPIAGDMSVGRQTWIAPGDQPRSFTVNFTIAHFAWTEAAFRFTPASNGTVALTVMGPWEQSAGGGPIFRQEVLWDACSATNTTLNNGSFELVSGGVPVGWTRPYGDATVITGPPEPVDGARFARTWHDGPLRYTLSVTGGVPVTLRFFARAQVPPDFIDMPRITHTNTPAHVMARAFMRGVNLGNYLEAPPGQNWGAQYSTNDFVYIRDEGFDHVRIPAAWHHHTGPAPDYVISNSFFAKVDFLVTNALQRGLTAMINIHHFDDFTTSPDAYTNKFYAIWRQIAAHYSNSPPQLAFELINEPIAAATTARLNPIYAEVIRQIRLSNPERIIFVGPGEWNSINELGSLRLPETDTNLIVTVHCYDPFLFTHQGATWAGNDPRTVGVIFPGPPATPLAPASGISSWATNWIESYNTLPTEGNPSSGVSFKAKIAFAKQWSDYYGRPVHVGEFGAYSMADTNSRARFYHEIRSVMDTLGLGWAMWDWKAGFRYWEDGPKRPAPGMREAMFPPVKLNSTAPGRIELHEAIGKTFLIERAWFLEAPAIWSPIQTQTLHSTEWVYPDPAATASNAAFYRALWLK